MAGNAHRFNCVQLPKHDYPVKLALSFFNDAFNCHQSLMMQCRRKRMTDCYALYSWLRTYYLGFRAI